MKRGIVRIAIPAAGAVWLALSLTSCGSDDSSDGSGAKSFGGSGPAGQGGAGPAGSGGGGGQGGAGGLPPGPKCCGGFGTCIDPGMLDPTQAAKLGQDACPSKAFICAPDEFLAGNAAQPCHSIENTEGRCGPLCIPEIGLQHERLPVDTCAASSRCAPCYHPADGSLTGICNLAGDTPKNPPYIFPRCGNGRGGCVPENLVPPERISQVPQDTCPQGRLCAPVEAIKNPNIKFPPCTSTVLACNCPGVCVPSYVANAQPGGNLLLKDNCQNPDDRCAPCTNPVSMMPTGACTT